jgi:hypothetical protein
MRSTGIQTNNKEPIFLFSDMVQVAGLLRPVGNAQMQVKWGICDAQTECATPKRMDSTFTVSDCLTLFLSLFF